MNDVNRNVRGIAHDLNNQIMILMNALDRIMLLCPQEQDAALALKAAERCALLASELVVQRGRPTRPHGSSVREIVSEAAMRMRPLLPAFNRLEVSCKEDCWIAAPSDAIQQAVVNLCINAIDAMDGPGVVRIDAERVGGSVILSVRDTGPGVPEELRERIFQPLFSTRRKAKNAHGGSGLGLTRVREIAQQSGGEVSVGEVFPHGAWFRIVLPALSILPTIPSDTLKFENPGH